MILVVNSSEEAVTTTVVMQSTREVIREVIVGVLGTQVIGKVLSRIMVMMIGGLPYRSKEMDLCSEPGDP